MNRTASLSALAAVALAGSTAASADILGLYTFNGLTDLPAAASSVDPDVTVSNLTEGAGLHVSVVTTVSANFNGHEALEFIFSTVGHDNTDEASAIADSEYMEFTVTPQASTVDFTSISWTGACDFTNTNRNLFLAVRSSADSYAATLDTQLHTISASPLSFDLDISSLTGHTGPVTFRIYFYDNSNSGGKRWIEDLTINGTAVIPEPASVALAGLGGLLMLGGRRRR